MLHIVVPVYNEADNIGPTLEEIRRHVEPPYEVVIVYDFEEDNTLPAARAWQARHPEFPLRFLRNDLGRGAVNALKKGLGHFREGAVLVLMADLSDELSLVNQMHARLEAGDDLVCASRYMKGGAQIGGPWLKGTLSRLAGLSLHWLTGLPTHDPTNSFKMYSAPMVASMTLESQGGFEIGLEIVVKCFAAGGRISELPTTWRDRSAGQSRFRLWRWLPHYLRWYLYALKRRWLVGIPPGPPPWRRSGC
jgi:glycosyltransferase involved in cell wall biosynthesis